jgi:murein L,D-transpeptidase YcbB/YkuD
VEEIRAGGEVRLGGAPIASTSVLPDLYERRGFTLAWTRAGAAAELLDAVRGLRADGLDPDDYHRAELERRLAEGSPETAQRVDLDLLLTDALVRAAYHLAFGKVDPEALDPNWNLYREIDDVDPVEAIQRAIDAPDVGAALGALRPTHPIYRKYVDALARYRAIAARGGWEPVPEGASLEPGAEDARVVALRRRLAAEGGSPADSTEDPRFDPELAAAVRRFQRLHGLDEDGVVGKATVRALSVPVEERIEAIRVNLERARWVLHGLDPDLVLVDIAGFRLRVFSERKPVWGTRVVVGQPYRATPVFRSQIRYLVLNPTWTVPPGILEKDILPAARRDPRSVARKGLRVFDRSGREVDPASVDWSRYRSARGFPYQLRQDPGPTNALGRIKFMFPNEFAVYLHDTPSRSLFEKTERAASSGCIRVQDPLELAVRLLDDPANWSRAALEREIEAGKTRIVNLPQPVPVILMYWTVDFEDDGGVVFRNDLYDRDAPVLAGLDAGFRFRRRPVAGRGRL